MKIIFRKLVLIVSLLSSCICIADTDPLLINELREKYKGSAYDQMTDLEIVDHIARKNGRAFDAVAYDYGVSLPDAPGFISSFQNSFYGIAHRLGKLIGDFVPQIEHNNALEKFGRAGVQRNPIITKDKNN